MMSSSRSDGVTRVFLSSIPLFSFSVFGVSCTFRVSQGIKELQRDSMVAYECFKVVSRVSIFWQQITSIHFFVKGVSLGGLFHGILTLFSTSPPFVLSADTSLITEIYEPKKVPIQFLAAMRSS